VTDSTIDFYGLDCEANDFACRRWSSLTTRRIIELQQLRRYHIYAKVYSSSATQLYHPVDRLVSQAGLILIPRRNQLSDESFETLMRKKQEGQHPLTGQRAANFRLLANQWAELRLVTQWRHGCRAMRRSVCNAGASNAGRSLCVQMSRERSCPCQYIDTTRKAIDCATTLPL